MRSALLPFILASVAVTAQAGAAEPIKPNIKPGLWEVTVDRQVSGENPMSIPPERLAKMTPEQRARLDAMLKGGNKSHTMKECMTPEKIARGFDMDRKGEDASCKRKVVSSSSNELTMHDECTRPDHTTVSDVHFEIKGGTQMSGKINVVVNHDGKTMTVNNTMQGKWVSASCGAVKDAEMEK